MVLFDHVHVFISICCGLEFSFTGLPILSVSYASMNPKTRMNPKTFVLLTILSTELTYARISF